MSLGCCAGCSNLHGYSGHMSFGQQHDHRFLSRLWVFVLPLVVTGAMDINPVLGWSKAMDPDMALVCSLGLDVSMALGGSRSPQFVWSWWQRDLWATTWPQVSAHTRGICKPLTSTQTMDAMGPHTQTWSFAAAWA